MRFGVVPHAGAMLTASTQEQAFGETIVRMRTFIENAMSENLFAIMESELMSTTFLVLCFQ